MQIAKCSVGRQGFGTWRRPTRQLCYNSCRVISSMHGAEKETALNNVCGELYESGSHAVTTLIMDLSNRCIVEQDITRITDALHVTLPKYINLRKLSIYAPYAALDGTHIQALMNMDSPFNELELIMWTFHTPSSHMWTGRSLRNLEIEVNDGVAFPYAVQDLLIGLKEFQEHSLNELYITNNTPHRVVVPHTMLPKVTNTQLDRIELGKPIWWFNGKPLIL